MSDIYKGDIGTKIRLDAGEDISGASSVVLKYRKPDGTEGSWTATVENSRYAYYTTTGVTDLDVAGTWDIQIYISDLSGWSGHGDPSAFEVVETIHGADEAQGYCDINDVQRYVKRVQFSTGNTKITADDVEAFIKDRYYEINAQLASAGISVPVSCAAKVSRRILRTINAVGAAADAESVPMLAQEKASPLGDKYQERFDDMLQKIVLNPKLLYDAKQVTNRMACSSEGRDSSKEAFPSGVVDEFVQDHRRSVGGEYGVDGGVKWFNGP